MNTSNASLPFFGPNTSTETVKESLKWLWKIHWLVFSVSFFTIGSYCLILIIQTIRKSSKQTRNYRLAVLSLIVIISFSRTLYLMFDPYEVNVALASDIPLIIQRVIYSLGQPSLMAGFGLIHALFLKIAKVRHYRHTPILKTKVIFIIIVSYFAFGILVEVITACFPNLNIMHAVSAGFSVLACTVVTATITYSGTKILRSALKNKKVLSQGVLSAVSAEELVKAKSVAKVSKLTLAAATFCAGMTIANSIAFVKMIMPGVKEWRDMWQLLIYVSCVRILEIAMSCTLLYALSRSVNKSGNISLLRRFTKSLRRSLSSKNHTTCDDDLEKTPKWLSTTALSSSHTEIMTV